MLKYVVIYYFKNNIKEIEKLWEARDVVLPNSVTEPF